MSSNLLENIALEFGKALMPLKEMLTSVTKFRGLLLQLGWDTENIPEPIEALLSDVIQLEDLLNQFGSGSVDIEQVYLLVESLKNIFDNIDKLKSAAFDPALMADNFNNEFPQQLIKFLLAEYLTTYQQKIGYLLKVFGILRYNYVSPTATRPDHVQKDLVLPDLSKLISNPVQLFENAFGWGTENLNHRIVYEGIMEFMNVIGVPAYLDNIDSEILSRIEGKPVLPGDPVRWVMKIPIFSQGSPNGEISSNITICGIPGDGAKLPGFAIFPEVFGELSKEFQITDNLFFTLSSDLNIDGGVVVIVRPNEELSVLSGFVDGSPTTVNGILQLELNNRNREGTPILILGSEDGTNLNYKSLSLKTGAKLQTGTTPEIFLEINLVEAKIEINVSKGDSFLQKIIPGDGLSGNLDLTLGLSSISGFYFQGSAGLEVNIPTHIDLGLIEIEGLTISVKILENLIPLEMGANVKGNLGPITVIIENVGLKAEFSFPDSGGNLGPLNLDIGFKPPNGVGLSIDAGVIKGGGYLYFDFDREEYAGALELVFSDWISLKAVGLITTKMPDGSKGFSLLIIITVEFGSGIQLGYGFTLLGVGGLLGLNRITNVDPLKEGIRTGAVESIMFPHDVIANAPKIISDLKKYFPPHLEIFLVGPMAKIGWGTPTLISVSIAVILEFPEVNITILGVIKVVLPDEDADILHLQVNFIGRVEPSNKLLWFYAELYDSRVLFITLEGGMGLLVNWGDNANFVISVGGFHPKYNPPPLPFPAPPRIAVNILNESYAKIRIEGYFAVTSNAVMFGASAEIFFGLSEFKIEGHLAFDALFIFNPFFFSISLSFSLSVKVFGVGLFSVGFSGLIEGPTPWHIKGKGEIGLLFFSISVPFEHTWGESKETKLDPIEVFPLLEAEFNALTNWEAKLPSNINILVSLRKLGEDDSDQLVLHPIGKLRISQRKVPIDYKLDKVGNQKPVDVNLITVEASITGTSSLSTSVTEEKFAIGQFKDLDDSSKLSSPGFEPLDSGVEIAVAGNQLKTSYAVKRIIRYETIIIDNNFKRYVKKFYLFLNNGFLGLNNFLFKHFLTGGAVSKSVLSQHYKNRVQPFKEVIEVKPNQYTVVFNSNNKPVSESASFTSQAKAVEYLEKQVEIDPNQKNILQVVPNNEVNLAA
jgi:Family of unknown function (DUF6603)